MGVVAPGGGGKTRWRSQWPRGLRCGSAAARLLGMWVRIPPGARMFISCECCVLSDRGLCVRLIIRPEEFYQVWCVWVWSWILDNEESCRTMVKKPPLDVYYVHVTVHRNKFLFNKTNRRANFPNLFLSRNSTRFGQFLCPSSEVFHCTFGTGICQLSSTTRSCLKAVINLHDIYQRRMYIGKLLMVGRGTVRNI